jgi:preprotein translocase subunit SecD
MGRGIQRDRIGLDSVPALFVDGQPAAWHDWALLKAAIEQVLVAPPTAVQDRRLTTPTDACMSTVPASSATPQPGALVNLELVLALQPAPGQHLDTPTLVGIRAVLQRRLALLGLSGDVLRRRDGQILVRVDVTDDPGRVTHALAESMLLEIIDPQDRFLPPGTAVETTLGTSGDVAPASASTPVAASGGGGPVYETIISGADFSDVYVMEGNTPGVEVVGFELQGSAASTFYQYTSTHVGQPMSIVIDKRVISSPTINGAISTQGIIEGVSPTEVDDLVVQLKAGALAVPLALVECRIVSAAESALTGDPEAVTADALAGYRLRA